MTIDSAESPLWKTRLRALAATCIGQEDRDALSCTLDEADHALFQCAECKDFSIEGNKLVIVNVDARDQLAAEHYYFDRAEDENAGPISIALEIRGHKGWRECGVVGRYLALASNDVDIFQCAADSITPEGIRTFNVLNVIQSALPHLEELSIAGLISLCEAQHEHTKGDLTQGRFFTALGDRYATELDAFRDIIVAVHDRMKETNASLYTMSLLRISETEPLEATEQAIRDVAESNPVLVANALWALGRMTFLNRVPDLLQEEITRILDGKAKDSNEDIRHAAYTAIVEGAVVYLPLADILNHLLRGNDQTLLSSLAWTLSQRSEEVKANPYFNDWLTSLTFLSPESEVALGNFDSILDSLLDQGKQDLVVSCVEKWVLEQGGNISKKQEVIDPLEMTFQKLLQDADIRSRLITKWLVSDEREFVFAAKSILGELHLIGVKDIRFSLELVDHFDTGDLILLIRRMLGVILFYEDQPLSLLVSLLDTEKAEERTYKLVEEVLTNKIGIDFPSDTKERLNVLKAGKSDPKIDALCDRVTASIDTYLEALNDLPRTKEFAPNRDFLLQISRQRAKTMAAHQKAAEETSIIMTYVPLKAGKAMFSFHNGSYGEPSHLQSFEHFTTLPRRHTLDEVGFELLRRGYQRAKKGQ